MAITEEIDLTLESDFASEYDERLKPRRIRSWESCKFFPKSALPLHGLVLHISFNAFFNDWKKDDIIEETLNCYFRFFGMSPRFLERWGEYDPYASYMFGGGIKCDCCGMEFNILNKGKYVCKRCENNLDREQFVIK